MEDQRERNAEILQSSREMKEARETIQKYIDGANGDLKVLKEAYNEKALINGNPRLFSGQWNITDRLKQRQGSII